MSADLQDPRFTDETAAREALEAIVWPNGPICPHCGNADQARIAALTTKSARPGLRYCDECKGQFTATVGTIFERSKIPLTKWWLAMHLIGSSKKGISSHQLHRMLGVSYKSAWFMSTASAKQCVTAHCGPWAAEVALSRLTRPSSVARKDTRFKRGFGHKNAVLTLVERGGARARFHVENVTKERNSFRLSARTSAGESHVMTDEANRYARSATTLRAMALWTTHVTNTATLTAKPAMKINTNTVEGYYSIFKRGMKGVYQHCGEKHLAPLSRRVRFPLLKPNQAGRKRRGPRG